MLRMSGVITLLPYSPYMPSWRRQGQLRLYIQIFVLVLVLLHSVGSYSGFSRSVTIHELARARVCVCGWTQAVWLETLNPTVCTVERITNTKVQWRYVCISVTLPVLTMKSCQHLAQLPSWRTTPGRLSATAYWIYSQLPSILEAVPPPTTWVRATPWWQGPTDNT